MRLFEKLEKWFSLNKKKVSPENFNRNCDIISVGVVFFSMIMFFVSYSLFPEPVILIIFFWVIVGTTISILVFLSMILPPLIKYSSVSIPERSMIVSEGRVLRTYMIGMTDWKSNIPADELKDIEKGQLIQGVFKNRKIVKTVILDQDSVEPDISVVVVLAPFETKEGIQSYYDFLRKYNFCECTIAKIIDAIIASCLFDGILYSYAKSLSLSTSVEAQRNDSKSEFSRFLSERLDKIGMTLISCNIEKFDPEKNKEDSSCGNSCCK